MDIVHKRSKRRCTLYPGKQGKTNKNGTNKTKPVQIVKHFESNSQAASQNQTELPFLVIEEEDEDVEVVSANVQFYPNRYTTQQTFSKKDSNRTIEEIISSISNRPRVNEKFAFPKKIQTPEKFLSEIPLKTNKPPHHIIKKEKFTTKTTNKRSSSLASSRSNPVSEDSYKKTKPTKSKTLKQPAKTNNDNIVHLKQDVNRLTNELHAIENKIKVNLAKKHKLTENNDQCSTAGSNRNQCIPTSIKPEYAIVTESYIQSLKDEIHCARSKPANEITRTANQLKAEINQFRNSNIPKLHSTNTNVKITLPKNNFHNTLDLKITNSLHNDNRIDTKEESVGCTCGPILPISNVKETNVPSSLKFEQTATKIQTNEENLKSCQLPEEDTGSSSFRLNEFFTVRSHFSENIQPKFTNYLPLQNEFNKKDNDSAVNCDLIFPICDEVDEKETIVQTLETEFSMSVAVSPEAENQNKQECPCKIDELLNHPVARVDKESTSSKVATYQDAEETKSHVSIRDELLKIDAEDSPILPIIMNAVHTSMNVKSSTTSTAESMESIERAQPKQVLSTPNLEDQKYCAKLLQEQNDNVKALCNLLVDLAKKFKTSPCNENDECNINEQQLVSKEPTSNEQILEKKREFEDSVKAEEQCRTDECTQVNWKNFDENESPSTTSSEAESEGDINAQDDDLYSTKTSDNITAKDVPETDTLPTISEGSEKSSATERTSIRNIPKDQMEIPSLCKAHNCPASSSVPRINNKNTKAVKPLKDRATEVLISSVISQKIKKGVKLDAANQEKQSQPISDINSQSFEISLKSKLSIQLMPSIDIRRGLVTQTIPAIVINPSESTPQNVLQNSNVAYEIIKHISDEIINNLPVVANRSVTAEGKLPKLQSDKGVQTKKIKSKVKSDLSTKRQENSDLEIKIPPTVDGIQETQSDFAASENSSVPTCTDIMFEKLYPTLPPDDVKASVEAIVKIDMPVTTFLNTCFQPETESEILVNVNNSGDLTTPSSENTDTSSSCRKSTVAEYLGKQGCVKEFINKMIKDPNTEVIFKSYQVVQEQEDHDPRHEIDPNQLSSIDTDFYRTYVNPQGLENTGDTNSEHKRNIERKKKVVDKYLLLPVTTPPAFYVTKSTQCDEIIGNVSEDEQPKEKTIDDVISELGEDDVSQNTTILNFDDVSRNYDTGTLLSYKEESKFDSIIQDPNYVSRNSYELPHALSTRGITKHSRSHIPPDVQKGLSGLLATNRPANPRRSSQTSRMLDILSSHSKKSASERLKTLPSSDSLTEINVVRRTSAESNSTEDVILEINRDKLRSKTHYSIGANSQKGSENNSRKGSTNSGRDAEAERSNSTASEYVITRDISIQTSLVDASEEVLNLHQFSNQNLESSIEKLKIIVEEDIRNETEPPNISCCSRLQKKTLPQDAYLKSTEPEQTNEESSNDSSWSEQKSVKLEVPERVPLYKPRQMTLSLPARVFRRLSRKGPTPVESFIEGLTSHNKNEIFIAKNTPPRNELSVLEEYDSIEIVNAIKQATENWKGPRSSFSRNSENSLHASAENLDIRLLEVTGNPQDEQGATLNANNRNSNSSSTSMSNVEAYTIMPVNVTHPDDIQIQEQLPTKNIETEKTPQRNAPGGDEVNCAETIPLCSTHTRHEGIFPRYNKFRQNKKISESSSSSEATTLERASDRTDGNLSEGEVKCTCSASIGEIHVCPCIKNIKTIQHLKKNPKRLLKREFGSPSLKIQWQKEFNSNWVAYYVSRSPSPDNADSLDRSSTYSSGIIRK